MQINKTLSDSNKKGFSLGEFLIVLFVIGVLVALTISPIVKSFQDRDTVTKLKKANAVFAQAVIELDADGIGPVLTWKGASGVARDYGGRICLA